jgi:hypothetical protein
LDEVSEGLVGERVYVPLVRGGHRAPLAATRDAILWSTEAIRFYKTDAKARFQNSRFYFQKGLAVPMVTSGRITASLMHNAVFDQGVVGIFPYQSSWLPFLLIFLNSPYATTMKRAVNPTANNSANYLKEFKLPNLSAEHLGRAAELVELAKVKGWGSMQEQMSSFLGEILPPLPR